MLETAVTLTFAHLVADFVLQTDRMVRAKHRLPVLATHNLIVAATAWTALGLAPLPLPILLIAGSHFATDWIKLRRGGPGFATFALDQAAHFVAIFLVALFWPDAYQAGLWGQAPPPTLAPWLARLPAAMALGAGLIGTVWVGGYAVAALMLHMTPSIATSLPRGGRLIGRLERLLILMLVLVGEVSGIGFLITAKSILRFGEVSRADEKDPDGRSVSEYVIIGTLASFAWALGVSYATLLVLAALRAT